MPCNLFQNYYLKYSIVISKIRNTSIYCIKSCSKRKLAIIPSFQSLLVCQSPFYPFTFILFFRCLFFFLLSTELSKKKKIKEKRGRNKTKYEKMRMTAVFFFCRSSLNVTYLFIPLTAVLLSVTGNDVEKINWMDTFSILELIRRRDSYFSLG